MSPPRVLAVDWSGRAGAAQRQHCWLAEAADGALVRLESGRTRDELIEHIIAAAERDPQLVVGFDFCFALPAWYLTEHGLRPDQLWAALAEGGLTDRMRRLGFAAWLADPDPPFWTRRKPAGLTPEWEFRRTELELRERGARPGSVFRCVGAGQVGRGSLYGMAGLHHLSSAGFAVWPFTAGLPVAVEIYPRLLTGAVIKSSLAERARYLAHLGLLEELRVLAAASEDAFDAAISVLAMSRHAAKLARLPADPRALEGQIWHPGLPGGSG